MKKIIDYTVEYRGVYQAVQYLDALEAAAQLLANNPDIEAKCDTLSPGLLSVSCQSHILYYLKK